MKLSLKNLLSILSLVASIDASEVISPSPPTSSDISTPFVRGRTFINGESKVANAQLADVYGCCTSTSLSADGKYYIYFTNSALLLICMICVCYYKKNITFT